MWKSALLEDGREETLDRQQSARSSCGHKYASLHHIYATQPAIQNLAGLTCGLCHIAFNPAKPPADPENPQWENLAPAFGNQYLREAEMFKGRLTGGNFLYWVYETQQAGTSDTSRLSTDFINNPNAINSIWYILSARPKHKEVMNDGTTAEVPHILKDGSDSVGAAGAGLRVYINIGSCPDYRYSPWKTHLREFCGHFRCCRCQQSRQPNIRSI